MDTIASRGELQDLISRNAAQDPNYRAALIQNPRNLIEQHFGHDLPDWMTVEVVEETADTVYLVVPHVPCVELSDEDLEMVAGGKGGGGPKEMSCKYNYGAFNSNKTVTSEVSLF